MQVFNQTKQTILPQTDVVSTIKEGSTYHASVKEKLPNNEAIVHMKGQDVRVKVDGKLPNSGKVVLRVMDGKQEVPIVKPVSQQTPETTASPKSSLPENVKQAIQLLNQSQIPITRELITNVKTFMEKAPGSTEQKLETIRQMAGKQLDLTPAQLKAVHETLHGPAIGKVLQELAAELDPKYLTRNDRLTGSKQVQLQEVLRTIVEKLADPKIVLDQQTNQQLARIVQRLATEFGENYSTDKILNQAQLRAVIHSLAQRLADPNINIDQQTMQPLIKSLHTIAAQLSHPSEQLTNVRQQLGKLVQLGKIDIPLQLKLALEQLTDPKMNIALQRVQQLLQEVISTMERIKTSDSNTTAKLAETLKLIQQLTAESTSNAFQQNGAKQVGDSGPSHSLQNEGGDSTPLENSQHVGKQSTMQSAIQSTNNNEQMDNLNKDMQQLTMNRLGNFFRSTMEIDGELLQTAQTNLHMDQEPAVGNVQTNKHVQSMTNANSDKLSETIVSKSNAGFDLPTDNRLTTNLQEALKQVKEAPNLTQVLDLVKENLPDQQQLDIAIIKAEQLLASGRELAARQELAKTLTQMEEALPQASPNQDVESSYRLSSDLFAQIPVQSRDLLVTAITRKLAQAALDFKAVKRDIVNALSTAESVMKQAPIQARTSLEAAIKQLDNAILKSDFMLYTDMSMEKKLLQASSQLQEARKWLAKGEPTKANEIVHQVKATVDKLIFQPSDQRVKHFVAKEALHLEPLPIAKQLTRTYEEPLQLLRQEPTPRHILEYMNRLGLNYDSEMAHRLATGEQVRQEADASLKNLLMRIIQAEGNQAAGQKADQALQNFTGQQLLSKPDSSGLQTMLFTLPLILRDQVENVKVFLRSNQQGQKLDWENCSLYFLLETQRIGDVGVLLTAVDKTISITLKNDSSEFQERMAPLVATTKERLAEIGYNIGSIQFAKLSTETSTSQAEKAQRPTFSERGYDFTV